MKLEQQIQKSILEYLAVKRIWCRRMNTGAVLATHNGKSRMVRYGSPGMADILCSVHPEYTGYPTFLWLEIKAPNGRQSEAQHEFEDEVLAEGHKYFIVYSIEDVEKALQSL